MPSCIKRKSSRKLATVKPRRRSIKPRRQSKNPRPPKKSQRHRRLPVSINYRCHNCYEGQTYKKRPRGTTDCIPNNPTAAQCMVEVNNYLVERARLWKPC